MEALVSDLSREAVLIMDPDNEGLSVSFGRIGREWGILADGESVDPMENARSQYSKAFVGPGKLAAYPWESMYVETVPGLFQDSTLAVRRSYAAQGMKSAHLNAEPDDHIATELHFMSKMSERSIGSEFDLSELISVQISFLDDHLLQWIAEYAAKMQESGVAPFYSAVLGFAAEFVRVDRAALGMLFSDSGRSAELPTAQGVF